ncbi:hypothetical protein CANTEDRAFT_112266 [Yamadazyma tenuis ATCC 10573]|uniref:Uncharacterized protein n=1 Tax=Candida tenuis (strain ATCC 10573 / BCRC 21748 / CBS 615 / JCM 9827 / NBRC 10315 / NRRL Y-1498 / VKM Y-70) TaxID=590646 RepID=G3AWI4_CANTC|nr:uncharacterized protein CANTEDRAFT_112266 [Yamadazyma tenuis ATCC 10573]EGV66807.1 hypothetical protein CANTEDRAFT_112266 [Yamadazyma tenuis ATCC 10573]
MSNPLCTFVAVDNPHKITVFINIPKTDAGNVILRILTINWFKPYRIMISITTPTGTTTYERKRCDFR